MTGRDFDTDPSTPGAIRGATADTDPAGGGPAEARKPNTDPGLGPGGPPQPVAMAGGPSSVRVPPVGRQDSVEMLLDNMAEPQPERRKTTPQSAGEASAAYHAEHPIHPATTSPDDEPKVIVERPPQPPTVKLNRSQLQAVIESGDALRRAREAEQAAAAKAVVPVSMGPKVLIAAVAGLVVVLGIFLVVRGKSAETESAAAGSAATTASATAGAPATATATAVATAGATATAAATVTGTATATVPVADTTEEPAAAPPPTMHVPVSALPPAPAATAKPRPRPAASGTGGDLGEFKTTFH